MVEYKYKVAENENTQVNTFFKYSTSNVLIYFLPLTGAIKRPYLTFDKH